MITRVIAIILVIVAAGAGYMYRSSQVKPQVFVATDTTVSTGVATGTTAVQQSTTLYNVTSETIGWKGTKPSGFHTGTIAFSKDKPASLKMSGSMLVGGEFSLDMNTIKLLDITDTGFEAEIKNGLFEAQKNPLTTFVITQTSMSGTQTMVKGNLTIKGITKTIQFPATVSVADGGADVTAKAQFAIDRLLRGLNKREGMVNNFLEFDVEITATR